MKNVHLIPTEKPSVLRVGDNGNFVFGLAKTYIQSRSDCFTNQHIYITSDESLKKEDWKLSKEGIIHNNWGWNFGDKKIILTTDQDLIKDGVQAIDDEFLWWFSENPSCERVEIENKKVLVGWEPDYTYEDLGIDGSKNVYHNFYKIIIPQEEPKQETLEEASLRIGLMEIELNHTKTLLASCEKALENRDNQAQRMYSEEEVKEILMKTDRFLRADLDLWFEQFKKK